MVGYHAGTSSRSSPGRSARVAVVVAASLVLAVCGVLGAVLVSHARAAGGGAGPLADPVGDAGQAADVTAVAVTGDRVLRLVDVEVTAGGFLPFDADGRARVVSVWLDTDDDASTGGPETGAEFVLNAWRDVEGDWWDVERWDGSGWRYVPESATQCFLLMGDTLLWTVHANDLDGVTSFRFTVTSSAYDVLGGRLGSDRAPDDPGQVWWYDLASEPPQPEPPPAITSVKLRVLAPTAVPKAPVVGKRFSVSFPVVIERVLEVWVADPFDPNGGHRETITLEESVRAGTLACAPSVGGTVLAHTESLRAGVARLVFVVPKTAKGRLLKVTVKIATHDSGRVLTGRRAASFRVH